MYLDPFDGGALYDAEALSRRLGAIFGAPVALGSDALRPTRRGRSSRACS